MNKTNGKLPGSQALSSGLNWRPARSQESAAIAQLVNSAYRGDSSRKGWTTEADLLAGQRTDPAAILALIEKPDSWLLVCEKNDCLIASVHLEKKDAETCYLGMFTVSPELQAGGIGKQFIDACEKFAWQELKCEWMEITVITVRQELISWYERRGYQFTNEVREFPYHDQRFGIPLRDDILLGVWKKKLGNLIS